MRNIFYVVAIALIFNVMIISGCVGNNTSQTSIVNTTSVVANGDHISVDYTGMLENGTVFDSSIGRTPLQFVAGSGQMIKGFDDAVIGMVEGREKIITIKPEDAYGMPDSAKIIDVPIKNVPNNTKVGDILYSSQGQQVKIVAINSTTVTVDTNNPLAGKTLIFNIKILNITKSY